MSIAEIEDMGYETVYDAGLIVWTSLLVVGLLKDEWMTRRTAMSAERDGNPTVSFGHDASPSWSWPPKTADGYTGEMTP